VLSQRAGSSLLTWQPPPRFDTCSRACTSTAQSVSAPTCSGVDFVGSTGATGATGATFVVAAAATAAAATSAPFCRPLQKPHAAQLQYAQWTSAADSAHHALHAAKAESSGCVGEHTAPFDEVEAAPAPVNLAATISA